MNTIPIMNMPNMLNAFSDMLLLFLFVFTYFLKKFKDINDVLDKKNRTNVLLLCSFLFGIVITAIMLKYNQYINFENQYIAYTMYFGVLILFYILFPLSFFSMLNILFSARKELNFYYQDKERFYENRSSFIIFIFFYFVATPLSMLDNDVFKILYAFAFCGLIYSLGSTKELLLDKKLYYKFD